MKSSDIHPASFRQILFLPLILKPSKKYTPAEGVRIVLETLTRAPDMAARGGAYAHLSVPAWEKITDRLGHLGSPENDPAAYAEFVYFHPYIQRFLYGDPGEKQDGATSPLHIFTREGLPRSDATSSAVKPEEEVIEVEIETDGKIFGHPGCYRFNTLLNIDRFSLYLTLTGVAVLVLEVSLQNKNPETGLVVTSCCVEEKFTLAHAQTLQNALRRIYPPYFVDAKVKEYPLKRTWKHRDKDYIRVADSDDVSQPWISQVVMKKVNPFAPFWRRLLEPLNVEGYATATEEEAPVWRQIIDERLPSMAFIGVKNAFPIERGDFVRLCFLDDPGAGLPYSDAFLANFERDHCYDRHWRGMFGTRFLFSGYSCVVVGSGDPADPYDFFHGVIQQHFRRHYFQIGLLIQLQFAILLSFSDRLSVIAHNFQNKPDDRKKQPAPVETMREETRKLEEEFLDFQQRHWFSQISNQLQPREMYAMWRNLLQIDDIYREVQEQLRSVNVVLEANALDKRTENTERLNIIAALGVIFGLTAGFLGMNIIFTESFFIPPWKDEFSKPAVHVAVFGLILFLVSGAGMLVLKKLENTPGQEAFAFLRKILYITVFGAAAISLGGFIWRLSSSPVSGALMRILDAMPGAG